MSIQTGLANLASAYLITYRYGKMIFHHGDNRDSSTIVFVPYVHAAQTDRIKDTCVVAILTYKLGIDFIRHCVYACHKVESTCVFHI